MARRMPPALLRVLNVAFRREGDILIEGAAEGDVQYLQASANPQHGLPDRVGDADRRQLVLVHLRKYEFDQPPRVLPIEQGTRIVSARQDEGVDGFDLAADGLFVLQHGKEDGDATHGLDGRDVVVVDKGSLHAGEHARVRDEDAR